MHFYRKERTIAEVFGFWPAKTLFRMCEQIRLQMLACGRSGNSRVLFGPVHTGRVCRFACKPFDVASMQPVWTFPFTAVAVCSIICVLHVARCSASCVNGALVYSHRSALCWEICIVCEQGLKWNNKMQENYKHIKLLFLIPNRTHMCPLNLKR